jgi:preprotein translocase subunit SecF
MHRIFHGTNYDFIRWWRTTTVVTVLFIIAGLGWMSVHGIQRSVEFTGGTLMQLKFAQAPNISEIRTTLDQVGVPAEIQSYGSNTEYTVRVQDERGTLAAGAEGQAQRITQALTQKYGARGFQVVRTEAIGPRVGGDLSRGAIIAVVISFGITLLYLAFRFEWRFGVSAVLATAHDILATLAFLAIMRIELSLTVVAGLLTVLGYSLNDTIIIFDRVRENMKRPHKGETLYQLLNRSVNETLPRSVLTHATTAAATLALLLFAGEVIRPFAWVMLFGIVTGTFSSIYVASPILLWIETRWPRNASAAPTSTGGTGTRPARQPADSRAARDAHPAPTR